MKRRTSYQTHYTGRHKRRGSGGAAKWLAIAAALGLIVYIALAMGLGTWIHEAFIAEKIPEETEQEDIVEQTPEETKTTITETVAFPAMEVFTLSVGTFDDKAEAQQNALLYAARGGAGYIDMRDGYTVLLSAYENRSACENVAEKLKEEENITTAVYTITADAVELKLTALPQRIDGIRDAFSIWQQTTQMLSDLWQDVDSGVCSLNQAVQRLTDQRDKLKATCDTAFSDALIQGQSTALDGLYDVLTATIDDIDAIIVEPPKNILDVSSKIKYTGIRSLTQYQSYVETLKKQLT